LFLEHHLGRIGTDHKTLWGNRLVGVEKGNTLEGVVTTGAMAGTVSALHPLPAARTVTDQFFLLHPTTLPPSLWQMQWFSGNA